MGELSKILETGLVPKGEVTKSGLPVYKGPKKTLIKQSAREISSFAPSALTHVVFILDASGSMRENIFKLERDYNEFLGELIALKPNIKLTTISFNDVKTRTHHSGILAKDARKVEIRADGCTPLNTTILETVINPNEKVLMAILTDGQDTDMDKRELVANYFANRRYLEKFIVGLEYEAESLRDYCTSVRIPEDNMVVCSNESYNLIFKTVLDMIKTSDKGPIIKKGWKKEIELDYQRRMQITDKSM